MRGLQWVFLFVCACAWNVHKTSAAAPVGLDCLFVDEPDSESSSESGTIVAACSIPAKKMINDVMLLLIDPVQYPLTKNFGNVDIWESLCLGDSDLGPDAENLSGSMSSCMTELTNGIADNFAVYAEIPPTPENCPPEIFDAAKAAVGVVQMLTKFICLANSDGVPCPYAVGTALQDAGLMNWYKYPRLPDTEGPDNIPKACDAFVGGGCCSETYFQILPVYHQLVCSSGAAEAAGAFTFEQVSLPATCPLPPPFGILDSVPAKCAGFEASDYNASMPESCPYNVDGNSMTNMDSSCESVDIKTTCPTNMCQFGCVMTNSLLTPLTATSVAHATYVKSKEAQDANIAKQEGAISDAHSAEAKQKGDLAAAVAKDASAASDAKAKGDAAGAQKALDKDKVAKDTLSKQLGVDNAAIAAAKGKEIIRGEVHSGENSHYDSGALWALIAVVALVVAGHQGIKRMYTYTDKYTHVPGDATSFDVKTENTSWSAVPVPAVQTLIQGTHVSYGAISGEEVDQAREVADDSTDASDPFYRL